LKLGPPRYLIIFGHDVNADICQMSARRQWKK
jgi:hypothetical protein